MQAVISNKKRIAIPIMTHPGIELIGKTVLKAVSDGYVHFDAIKALDQRYPSAACTAIMDLTVEAEAFGAKINFSENEVPTVVGRLVSDRESVEKLQIPDLTAGRIPQYILANKLTAEYLKKKPGFAGIIGPFSLAGRLYDISEFMVACYCEPDVVELLLNKCTEFLKRYCLELKRQGANGVLIAEPAAGLLSGEDCGKFSSQYVKMIVETVQDDNFMVVLHNCGNTGQCTGAMLETGAWGYHFGNKIDMVQALNDCPPNVLVMGNLDPVAFKSATSEAFGLSVSELLKATSGYPNYVLSSGCDVPPHTPQANIEAFYGVLEEYGI
jgi:uroporphyrinogen decarboxylase